VLVGIITLNESFAGQAEDVKVHLISPEKCQLFLVRDPEFRQEASFHQKHEALGQPEQLSAVLRIITDCGITVNYKVPIVNQVDYRILDITSEEWGYRTLVFMDETPQVFPIDRRIISAASDANAMIDL
jgi:hypothetical protein